MNLLNLNQLISRYWNTVKYLKTKQVFYRLFYSVKKRVVKENRLLEVPSGIKPNRIGTLDFIPTRTSYFADNEFSFLNLSHPFKDEIDWNYSAYGKLWTYNLCYFDFLLQDAITKEQGVLLMLDFKLKYAQIKDGLEPYPSSLRVMNCVKFVSKHQLKNEEVDQLIYSDLKRVSNNLEFHLLGNHLLENAFALLMGAIYFSDKILLKTAEKLLKQELEEQILADGGHFELSPMYHQVLLSRTLDGINLMSNNESLVFSIDLLNLRKYAGVMLAWLENMTFDSGEVPMMNDSAPNIAPNSQELFDYASRLSIEKKELGLQESGYRKHSGNDYELICDVGNIGPDYIPGHAHSDTFNFVVYHKNASLIVDTGISTYEKNELRQDERATSAHNTVMVNGTEQSEIWGGFRVGKRARIIVLEEDQNEIKAEHDGYKQFGVKHQRHFSFTKGSIVVEDLLSKACKAKAFIHFHPTINVSQEGGKILGDFGEIKISGFENIALKKYNFAQEFNKRVGAMVLEVEFAKELRTEIHFA